MSAAAPRQGAAAPFSAPDLRNVRQRLRQRLSDSYERVAAFLRDPLSPAIDAMIREAFPLETRGEATMAMRRFHAREYLREASKRHPEWNVRRLTP